MQISSATRTRTAWLLASTPVVLLLTHYAAVLPHEFMHSIVAWLLGIKANPLLIGWGGTSILNILLLIHVDENVDYTAALEAGRQWQVALTAFAGPGLANGGLYLLSRRLIKSLSVARRPLLAYVLFWFLFMNLANLYDYVPLRVFADGDVHHFELGTGISPWVIYAVGGYLVLWGLVDFYRVVLPYTLRVCGFESRTARTVVLIVATAREPMMRQGKRVENIQAEINHGSPAGGALPWEVAGDRRTLVCAGFRVAEQVGQLHGSGYPASPLNFQPRSLGGPERLR